MKTPKTYKFSDITLARIADIETWLPADSATHAVEQAIADYHKKLEMQQQLGSLQVELNELWQQFQHHPNYDIHKTTDGVEVIYNAKERAKWSGRKGIFSFTVLERAEGIYKTAYTVARLRELATSERYFVP